MRQKSNWCICPPPCMVPIILLSFNCQFPLRNRNKLVTWDVKTLLDSSSQAHVLKCFSGSASQHQQRLWSGWSFIPCKIKDTSHYWYFRFKTVFVYLHFLSLHRIKICPVPEWTKKIDNLTDVRTAYALSTQRPGYMEHVNGTSHICKLTCIDVCE